MGGYMKKNKFIIAALAAFTLTACSGNHAVEDRSNNQELTETNDESVRDDTKDKDLEKEADSSSNDDNGEDKSAEDSQGKLTITDAHGEVEVPQNPKKVVALDNRTFDVLDAMDVDLLAAPKDVMPEDSSYVADDNVENIGNHREPNLEVIAAMDPDLVIVGQRFESYYDEIKDLVPNASVIDLNVDVSEEAESPGNNLIEGFMNSTMVLGEIFDKEDKATELIEDLEESIENASTAYDGGSVMGLIVSGGEIGYSAPKYGRVWGPIFEILELEPALEVDHDSSDHKGDDISVEAIASSNPDYLLVLDRDAAVSSVEDAKPARDVLENSQALSKLEVVNKDRIYYAPNDTYTNESIITFTDIFNGIADSFNK